MVVPARPRPSGTALHTCCTGSPRRLELSRVAVISAQATRVTAAQAFLRTSARIQSISGHGSPAGRCPAMALHGEARVGQEHGIVEGELLTGRDVPHAHQKDVAAQAHIRLARVVHPHHHAVVLVLGQRSQETVRRDLERRVPDRFRQARDGRAIDDMAAFNRDHFPARDRLDGMHTHALDAARAALHRFRGNPRSHPRRILGAAGRHGTTLAHRRSPPGRHLSARSHRPCDVVVGHGGLAVDEVVVILRVEDGDLDVLAREAFDVRQ